MKPIIVGIDPGTTIGLAILNTESEVVYLKSFRNKTIEESINKIIRLGTPLIIATDKAKVPTYVKNISAKIGCKIFSPKEDIPLTDKIEINKIYNNICENSHERDALAAAFFAYRHLKRLIDKTKNRVEREQFNEVLLKVISEEVSIYEAKEIISNKNNSFQNKFKLEEKTKNIVKNDKELLNTIAELKNEIRLLKFEIFKLKEEIKVKNKIIKDLKNKQKKRIDDEVNKKYKNMKEIISNKNKIIEALTNEKEETNKELNEILNVLSSDLLIVIPRVKTLDNTNNINNKYVIIDNYYNKELLEEAKKKAIIFTLNKKNKELIYIPESEIKVKRNNFIIASYKKIKKLIDEKNKKTEKLLSIIENYKEKRRR